MWWIYLILAIVLLAVLIIPPIITVKKVFMPKHAFYDRRIYMEEMNGCLNPEYRVNRVNFPFTIKSNFGYEIYGEFMPAKTKTNKTVVVMHGYKSNLIVSLKYAKMFNELGLNVVVFDNTNCGKSGGELVTMGTRELSDLKRVIAKARELTGENARIGLHGESLGGACAIMALESEKEIEFVIEDCAFTNLFDEVCQNAKVKYHVPKFPYMYISELVARIKLEFWLRRFSPLNVIKQNEGFPNVPMMFIHGTYDSRTPYEMAEKLFEAKKGFKYLYRVDYAEHARSFLYNKKRYIEETEKFLKQIHFI